MNLEKLTKRLIEKEGERLKPYRCTAGKLTIGVGRNIEDRGISREESRFLLKNDIDWCIAECEQQPWWSVVKSDDVRARVMVELCFNLGMPTLKRFTKTLAAVAKKDYATAAKEMMASRWAVQVGKRANELSEMMRTGKDQ